MLEVARLSLRYGRHQALDDVALSVRRGEILVVLGANGAGKSSLLKAIAGLVPTPGATIRMGGADLAGMAPHRVVEAGLALVPEGRGVFGALTVRENLLLGAHPARAREHEAARRAQVLALFPRLAERMAQPVRSMSGGEQQMVAIGRALMSAPEILLLDEPSLGLSPLLCGELFRALTRIREAGLGILLVEQNARRTLAITDRAIVLETGRVVAEGSAARIAADPAVRRAYLGEAA